jgi:hypothetical protein
MRFAIRDDDVNYFTKPERLETNYSEVWDICPISLSVVPFHGCSKSRAIPLEYWSGRKVFPIGDNPQIVDFLRKKIAEGRISIMMHGYSHKDSPDGYEFETGTNLLEKVREGKQYLESLFDVEIKTFVPPHNALSRQGMSAVVKTGLNIVGTVSLGLQRRSIINFARAKYFRLRWQQVYPYVLSFGDHKEVAFHSLGPSVTLDKLKADFDFARARDGDFVLATHHWEFDAMQEYEPMKMRDVFERLWSYVQGFDRVQYSTVDELFVGPGPENGQ